MRNIGSQDPLLFQMGRVQSEPGRVPENLILVKRRGFDDSAFHSFCAAQKGSWKGQGVNEFIAHFLKPPGDAKTSDLRTASLSWGLVSYDLRLELQPSLDQKQEEHLRETSRRKAQEELAYQQLG